MLWVGRQGALVGWQAQGIPSRPGPVLWARPVAGSPSGSSSQAVRAGGPRGVRGSALAGSFGQRNAALRCPRRVTSSGCYKGTSSW